MEMLQEVPGDMCHFICCFWPHLVPCTTDTKTITSPVMRSRHNNIYKKKKKPDNIQGPVTDEIAVSTFNICGHLGKKTPVAGHNTWVSFPKYIWTCFGHFFYFYLFIYFFKIER